MKGDFINNAKKELVVFSSELGLPIQMHVQLTKI